MNEKLTDSSARDTTQFDVIIVGAGISGMYMLHRMRQLGLATRVIELGVVRGRYVALEPLFICRANAVGGFARVA